MTRLEHLLTILSEECAETAQRASKAIRFGLDEIQPGQDRTNAERLMEEYADLVAVVLMVNRMAKLPAITDEQLEAKRMKVEQFLTYSEACGTLETK